MANSELRKGAPQVQGWGEKRQKITHSGEWKQLRLEDMRGGVFDDGG